MGEAGVFNCFGVSEACFVDVRWKCPSSRCAKPVAGSNLADLLCLMRIIMVRNNTWQGLYLRILYQGTLATLIRVIIYGSKAGVWCAAHVWRWSHF